MQNTKCSESLASCPVSITLDIASAPLHHRDVNNRTMAMKRPSHGTSASRSHQQKAFGHIGCATRPSQKENLHGIHPPSLTTTTYLCVQLCPCYCLSFVALLSKGRQWCAHANDERPPTASPSSFVALFGRKWTLWVMELLTIQRNPQGPGKKKYKYLPFLPSLRQHLSVDPNISQCPFTRTSASKTPRSSGSDFSLRMLEL